jgi:hypothetical protein
MDCLLELSKECSLAHIFISDLLPAELQVNKVLFFSVKLLTQAAEQ